MLGFGLGLRGGSGASPGPAAIFGATAFAAFDLADAAQLDQVSGGGSPVTAAGQPVGRVLATGTGQASISTASRRPTWQGNSTEFDGVDDWLELDAAVRDVTRNAAGLTLWAAVRPSSLAGAQALVSCSTTSAGLTRISVGVQPGGAVRVVVRRADGDPATIADSAAGVVAAGADAMIVATVDYLNGGANAISAWVNRMPVIGQTLSGTGNSSDTAGGRGRLGADLSAGPGQMLTGRMSRAGVAGRLCTATEAQMLTTYMQGAMG
jgi:hypothetical protein